MQTSMSKKTWNFMKKHLKKGAQINAKSHQKSMPKLVTKKIRKIIKNHVSLNRKNIEIHWKNACFWWFRRLHVRTGKVSKTHKKGHQNPSKNRWTIDTKNMLEKGMQKSWNNIKKWAKKGSEINKKLRKKRSKKRCEKKRIKKYMYISTGPLVP